MRAKQIIYTWDYHHGQATRVIVAGIPPLRGETMAQKQAYFAEHCDHIRSSMIQEPRGHANMLGSVITAPSTPDGDVGLLFLHPRGYFEMCGDSTFSSVAALIDSGIVPYSDPNGERRIKLDTAAGRVDVRVQLKDGDPVAITFNNVPSYSLGARRIEVQGIGVVEAQIAYGGLTYAIVEAGAVGIPSLKDASRETVLDLGSRVWLAARPADLITLWEPLEGEKGARVANFYAPQITGRTPSGTGLSARVALEAASGRLREGETFVHESLLGLRFSGRFVQHDIVCGERKGIIPVITARSYLMGTAQWVLHPDDPFQNGFLLQG